MTQKSGLLLIRRSLNLKGEAGHQINTGLIGHTLKKIAEE